MSRTLALVTTLLALGTACNAHPIGGYDDGPQIDENGISVPVPPPSLWTAPVQQVEIEGQLGVTDPSPMTLVYVLDTVNGGSRFVEADVDGGFRFEGFNELEIDVTQNCLEVWSEEPGAYGEMSIHSFFRVRIDADDEQRLITEQFFSGC